MDQILRSKLQDIETAYNELSNKLLDPTVISDYEQVKSISKARKDLDKIITKYTQYKRLEEQNSSNHELLKTETDPEMLELAKEELASIQQQLITLEQHLQIELLPQDPNDDKNVILEIRAGTGGDEAAIFVIVGILG